MSFVYSKALTGILNSTIDLDADDIRVLLTKAVASTSADTEADVEFVAGFATLGELTHSSYTSQKTSGRHTFTAEQVTEDLATDRAEFTAENITWSALTGETVGGAIIYKFVTNDAASPVIAWIDLGDITPAGADLTITWNSEGIIQLANV